MINIISVFTSIGGSKF